jgi:hypothetical protein
MKNALIIILLLTTVNMSCGKKGSDDCGSHNGNSLHRGPEGGCYYLNSNGNKTYVERSECKC